MTEVVRKRVWLLLEAAFVLDRESLVVVLKHGRRGDNNLDPGPRLEFGRDVMSGILRMVIVTDMLQIDGGMGK